MEKKWKIFEKCPFLSVMWRNFFIIIIEQNLEVPFIIIVNEIVGNYQWSPDSTGSQSLEIWKLTKWRKCDPFFRIKVKHLWKFCFQCLIQNNLKFLFRQKNYWHRLFLTPKVDFFKFFNIWNSEKFIFWGHVTDIFCPWCLQNIAHVISFRLIPHMSM